MRAFYTTVNYTWVNGVPLGGLPSSGFWDQTRIMLLTVLDIDDKVIKWKIYHAWVSRIQNVKQAFRNLVYNSLKYFYFCFAEHLQIFYHRTMILHHCVTFLKLKLKAKLSIFVNYLITFKVLTTKPSDSSFFSGFCSGLRNDILENLH